jgi:hypothetical protein
MKFANNPNSTLLKSVAHTYEWGVDFGSAEGMTKNTSTPSKGLETLFLCVKTQRLPLAKLAHNAILELFDRCSMWPCL